MTSAERKKIIAFYEMKSWSYQLVADHFEISRNQVAGIIFRHRHRFSKMVRSPNSKSRNKLGTGYHGAGVYPAMTALNTR